MVEGFDNEYTIYYFCDRLDPTGNDFPIAQRIKNEDVGSVYEVKD